MDESRPLPHPPRCRGVSVGPGHYTGCRYGFGDVAPYTPASKCPTCHGSGIEGGVNTTLPHSEFGDPDCCGCLVPTLRGDAVDIVCSECAVVLQTTTPAHLLRLMDEMELMPDEVAAEMCPHCGLVNLFPGFSYMPAFICENCGESVRISR